MEVKTNKALVDNPGKAPLNPGHKKNYDEDIDTIISFLEKFVEVSGKETNEIFKPVWIEAKRFLPYVRLITWIKRSKNGEGYKLEFNHSKNYTPEEIEKNLVDFFTSTTYSIIRGLISEAPEEKTKVSKFKKSGHLMDQMLKYDYPKDKLNQPSLFDILEPQTRTKIEAAKIERDTIVEGIRLSPSEQKLIDSLTKMLHEKSDNGDSDSDEYYSGNLPPEVAPYGGGKDAVAPKLAFTLYELTKEYKGGGPISGKDVENVTNTLQELESKKFLISYTETIHKAGGGEIKRKIEDFQSLIRIVKLSQVETNSENIEIDKKEESIILLSPIFRHQIKSKYILYPSDITRRTIIAYGSHNLSAAALRLREYLARELSSNRINPEIGVDRLYWMLNEKWMKESRKNKVKQQTEKAIETCKNLGLLESFEIVPDAIGGEKYVFHLDKDWE